MTLRSCKALIGFLCGRYSTLLEEDEFETGELFCVPESAK